VLKYLNYFISENISSWLYIKTVSVRNKRRGKGFPCFSIKFFALFIVLLVLGFCKESDIFLLKRPPARGTESFPGRIVTSNIPHTGLWSLVTTPEQKR
jgi:hypothetical protein